MSRFDVLILLAGLAAMIYCMDYLWKNMDWLVDKLEPLQKGRYSHPLSALLMLPQSLVYSGSFMQLYGVDHVIKLMLLI